MKHHIIALAFLLPLSSFLFGQSYPETFTDATTIAPGDKVWMIDVSETGAARDRDATLEQIVSPFAADPSTNSSFDAAAWALDLNAAIAPAWGNVTGTPTTLSGYGIADVYSTTAADAAFATAAQGALADSATQPGDNISTLTNDSGYIAKRSYVAAANMELVYSLYDLVEGYRGYTCEITRASDSAVRNFTGLQVREGLVDLWLTGTTGRVGTLYEQLGTGLDAVATTGALYANHAQYGPCLDFDATADRVYAVADDAAYKSASITLYHFSQFNSGAASPMLAGYPHASTHTTPFYRWSVGERSVNGEVSIRIDATAYYSDKPNGWWRKPQVYVHNVGATITSYVGDYALDNQAAGAISYPNAVGLYIGGRKGGGGELLDGYVFDFVLCSGTSSNADRASVVDALTFNRAPYFPFGSQSMDVGDFATATALGFGATNHPALIKDGSTYYLFYNNSTLDATKGIHVATAASLTGTWTHHGRVIAPSGSGFDEKIPFAPAIRKVGDSWVIWFGAQNASSAGSVGVASNSGDLTDPADWIKAGQIITPTFGGDTNTLDPVVFYDPDGYDPGTGDGSHPIWLIFASLGTALSEVYQLKIAYADTFDGTYTLANSGNPITEVDGQGYPFLWPGDIVRDTITGRFWKLQSYGVTAGTYADGDARCGWTYADQITGPWYWMPNQMEWIDPADTSDERSIEPGLFFEGGKLHVVTATDTDASTAARERITHYISPTTVE